MPQLIAVTLIWAFSFGLIGNVLAGVDSTFLSAVRLGLALLAFLAVFRPARVSGREAAALTACGGVQFGVMYLAYMKAYAFLPGQSHLVALFSILTPLYVVVLRDMRGRRFDPFYLAAALLAVAGAGVIEARSFSGDVWIGFGLVQVSCVAFAFGQVFYRDWVRRTPHVREREIFGWLCLGGFLVAAGGSALWTDWSAVALAPKQWAVLIYLGLIASGGGFFLFNAGAVRTNAGTLAAFNNAVIPVGMLVSLVFFGEGEGMSATKWARLAVGGALIAFAIVLSERHARARESGATG